MIAFLVGSTMWQYGQFKSNIQNLQFGAPQDLTQGMPDASQQMSQMINQIQTQLQNPAQTAAPDNDATATATTETKTYTAPDGSFSFEYPADWTPMDLGGQAVESANGKILFSTYKTAGQSMVPSINSLTVEESNTQTAQELMEKIEADLRAKNIAAKITHSEIVKGDQTISVIETKFSYTAPIVNTPININDTTAIIAIKEKIYAINITTQNNTEESDMILKSVIINNKAEI